MQGQFGQLSTMSGDLPLCSQCAEPDEQFLRLGQSPSRWGSEPGQLGWVGGTPEGQFEQQGCQVGVEHFRRATRGQRLVLRSSPQTRTDTRLKTTSPPTTLLGGILGDANGFQSGESRARIEPRYA